MTLVRGCGIMPGPFVGGILVTVSVRFGRITSLLQDIWYIPQSGIPDNMNAVGGACYGRHTAGVT